MRVRFTRFALAEYDAILGYIRTRSASGAEKVQLRLDKVISDLEHFPFIGTPVGHAGVRMMVATPYPYLVYDIVKETEGEIIVVDVRHGARDRNG